MASEDRTGWIGDRGRVARLAERVAAPGLVTLVGPPGIGKSRLAAEALRELAPVVVVEASGCADVADLAAALRRALDLPGPVDDDDALPRVLRARAVRVVWLDDFEHLAERAAEPVARWCRDAGCAFLITSRRPLRVAAEERVEVEALGTAPLLDPGGGEASSEAARLFLARARAARGDWTPSPRELEEVEEIVRRLEGIPLAIELAAARMRAVGTAELTRALARPLALSSGGPRDASSRRSTLRGAIAASWSLLTPWERAALAQLSVFRAGFTLEAAEAVVDLHAVPEAPWMLDVVQALGDHSLLASEPASELPERRFRISSSVRAFAAEQPEADPGAVERHRAWLLAHAEREVDRLEGRDGREALLRLDAVHEDLAHAAAEAPSPRERARFTLALAAHGAARGGDGGLGDRLAAARAALPEDEAALRARLAVAMGRAASSAGRHREAARVLSEARDEARDAGLRRLEGAALAHLASAGWRLGQVDGCEVHAREALAIARAEDDPALAALSLRVLSGASMYRDRLEEARTALEEARALLAARGDRRALGVTLDRLGAVQQFLGREDAARRAWEEALDHHRAVGNLRWEAVTRTYLAELALEAGEDEAAAALLALAADAHQKVGDAVAGTAVGIQLALLALIRGDAAAAHRDLDAAASTALGGEHRMHAHLAMAYRGVAQLALGRFDEAVEELCGAHRFFAGVDNPRLAALFGAWEAAARRMRGEGVDGPAGEGEVAMILASFAQIAAARAAARSGDHARARAGLDALEGRLGRGSVDARVAASVREALLRRVRGELGAALEADAEGRWLRPPGGARVDLSRRTNLRRIAAALIAARRDRPGAPVGVDALVAAGWPGERILEESAKIRLRVALSKLRKLGLARCLVTHPRGGYLLDPDTPLVLA